jgi:DNA helicase HerA-like ATPase
MANEAAADAAQTIAAGYETDKPSIDLGRVSVNGVVDNDAVVKVPLAMFNRHGLIAGATGTGKTITLQLLAENLSIAGVPVVVADMKGDLTGLSAAGAADGPAAERFKELGVEFAPAAAPVEYLSLGGIGPGVPVRATITDFGPQLLAKILGSNDTQEQSLGLLFHFADERQLPLVDLADVRAMLMFLDSDEGKADLKGIGGVSSQTIGVLLRQITALGDAGGAEYFGEPQFDVADLMRVAPDGRGVISSIELPAVQDKPALFSTALMGLIAELFESLPEAGDLDKPKLVFFFDESHLLFNGATKAFLDSVAQTVRLIRSKGVGIFFVTQNPTDIPAEVLSQLGARVQHALRAFTPDDAKALKQTVSTYPKSEFYDLGEVLTSLGIGEAVVTVLSSKGVPTPVAYTRLLSPRSRMGVADNVESTTAQSKLTPKYGTRVDPQSASEILEARINANVAAAGGTPLPVPGAAAPAPAPTAPTPTPAPAPAPAKAPKAAPKAKAGGGVVTDFLKSSQGKQLQNQVVRGVFGLLKKKM